MPKKKQSKKPKPVPAKLLELLGLPPDADLDLIEGQALGVIFSPSERPQDQIYAYQAVQALRNEEKRRADQRRAGRKSAEARRPKWQNEIATEVQRLIKGGKSDSNIARLLLEKTGRKESVLREHVADVRKTLRLKK